MASIAAMVDQAVRAAGVPIVGVSLADLANRATWIVHFLPEATDPQKATAQNVINTLVIDAAAQHTQDQTDVKAFVADMPLVQKAINLTILDQVNFIRARLPTPLAAITPAQWITAVSQKVDTL